MKKNNIIPIILSGFLLVSCTNTESGITTESKIEKIQSNSYLQL